MIVSVNQSNHMTKKQFRKDVEAKLDTTFGHLAKAADKKFKKILKKASQLLTDVLHKPEPKPKTVKTKKIATKTVAKVTAPVPKKKAPVKAVKKSAVKKK
jgi:hypothetical protein